MNFWEFLNARQARNTNVDLLIARTQRNVSVFTLTIIAGVAYALFLGPKLDPTVEKLLFTVLGGLLTAWAMQNTFWFGRPRAAGIPDPTTTTLRQTTELVSTPTDASGGTATAVAGAASVPQHSEENRS